MSRLHLALLGLLVGASALGLTDLVRTSRQANELAVSQTQLQTELTAARRQIDTLSSKIDALTAGRQELLPQAPQPTSPAAHPRQRPAAVRATLPPKPPVDPRWKKIEAQLDANQQQIAKTQEDLQKTSEELHGTLNSTRDELSGSIARTHDEVVALQRRGERNYHEFEILRSKQFEHVGPLSLSLRKADVKHRRFDVAMIVEDATLDKKNVNLFEPVWINLSDRPQRIEVVVNRIDKDRISGYVSEPKYKNPELAGAPATVQAQPSLKHR